MANDIGRKGPDGKLHLITGDEFEWSFRWCPDGKTPEPFPDDATVYVKFGNGDRWDWQIVGDFATLKVPASEADEIEDREAFRFYVGPKVVSFGSVKRWESR